MPSSNCYSRYILGRPINWRVTQRLLGSLSHLSVSVNTSQSRTEIPIQIIMDKIPSGASKSLKCDYSGLPRHDMDSEDESTLGSDKHIFDRRSSPRWLTLPRIIAILLVILICLNAGTLVALHTQDKTNQVSDYFCMDFQIMKDCRDSNELMNASDNQEWDVPRNSDSSVAKL
jgi:hypothetical protein